MSKNEHIEIQKKWQKRWEEDKIFESNPDNRPKFFLNFPYPYINAYQHIGHLFTLMRVEALARFKRLKGYNVLFPQGWHATGSPIIQAAKRVKNKEPKQIKIMKDMGFKDDELIKFEDPKYWIEFFVPEFKKDYKSMGISIDWRREFHTTSLNPYYDKFIKWQFNKLKEKGYVIKGKFPVVWDPKENFPVGDHDRIEGEGETPQEFILVKNKLDDGRFLVSATLRPDTILGITNLYLHPKFEYLEIKINNENWILGEYAVKRLKEQDKELSIIGKVKGKEFIGKRTEKIDGRKVLVLPATFLDLKFGTGIVHSVPSDSADDLIALYDLQKDKKTLEKYGLDMDEVKNIKPIPILDTPGLGNIPAKVMLEKYSINSQNEREKLEKIKKELYKISHHTATFNEKYKNFFSKNLHGLKVEQGKKIIKKELIKRGFADVYYQLTGKVVSRSLTECIVKIVDDQWFIDYSNPEWKKLAHKCLDNIKLFPEKARPQFNYVIDWLHEWACTREEGLGTRLPWDNKWLIESLSDSTIYMAYYTISHLIKTIDIDYINDDFFDYVFLGKNIETKIEKKIIDKMRNEFNYWYPVDFRNSGKDLIQNHLTFFIFNHTAIFEEDKWPKGIGTNGWVTVDGQKMSKSLGNMIPVRKMANTFGADASRLTILSGGEDMDDPNWDSELAKSMVQKLDQLITFSKQYYDKGRKQKLSIDDWMESRLNETIQKTQEEMEKTMFRTAIQKAYFEFQRHIKWYLRRSNNNPNIDLMKKIIETQLIILTPFTPHTCEEGWEKIGKRGYIINAKWPDYDDRKITQIDTEKNIIQAIADINTVKRLAKIDKPDTIKIFISPKWKFKLYEKLKDKLKETRNQKDIISYIMQSDLRQYGKEIMKIIPKIIKSGNVPDFLDQEKERKILEDAKDFLKKEYNSEIIIEIAENSSEQKSSQALPSKPAIVVE